MGNVILAFASDPQIQVPLSITSCIHSLIPYAVIALPFFWRLCMCSHLYIKTKKLSHIANAIKYCTAFPVIGLSASKRLYPEFTAINSFWLVAVIVNSFYSLYWDVVMDWGLIEKCFVTSNRAKAILPTTR